MNTDINTTSSFTTGLGSILVTGGTGLVGSHLIDALLQKGKQVKALYRSDNSTLKQKQNIEWVQGDVLDITSLEEAMQGVEHVYHCAAIVSFNAADMQHMFKVNIEGTANVVNACINAGVKKLCFVSSVSSLGRLRKDTVNESMNWSEETSNSNYGKSKYLAEMEVWRGIGEGLQAVIVNPVIILGASDWSKGSSAIFKSAYNEFPWYTEGVSGFVDVQDVVKAMMQLMDSDISNERFIISSENKKYKDVFTAIAKNFNKKPPHKKVNALLAQVVWRAEAIKSKLTGIKPLLTKETSATAQAKVYFDNSKLLKFLPSFTYTTIDETIKRVCRELEGNNKI